MVRLSQPYGCIDKLTILGELEIVNSSAGVLNSRIHKTQVLASYMHAQRLGGIIVVPSATAPHMIERYVRNTISFLNHYRATIALHRP
jgi:hypothetical protein